MTPLLSVFPPQKKTNKQTNLHWNQENLGCPDEPISIWSPHMKSEGSPWTVGSQSEESMNDTQQKASLISEQRQTRSRPNSSLILRHTVQSPALCRFSLLRWEAYCFALSGSAAREAALLWRRAQVELRAWVGLCTANVLDFGPGYVVKLAW